MSAGTSSSVCSVDLTIIAADGTCHWMRRPTERFTFTKTDVVGRVCRTPAPLLRWVEEQKARFPDYREVWVRYHWNEFE